MTKINHSLVFLLCSVVLHSVCDGYKLLVLFPFPGKSHGILGEAYVRTLLEGGHEVTYIAAVPIKESLPGLRQIDVSDNVSNSEFDSYFNVSAILDGKMLLGNAVGVFGLIIDMMNSTIRHEGVQALMMDPKEQFDAVIVEWMMSELYSGFAPVFGCPLIWSSSMEPHGMILSIVDEWPNPAYTPDQLKQSKTNFNFVDRLRALMFAMFMKVIAWVYNSRESQVHNEGFGPAAAMRGHHLPPYDVARYNASLILANSHMTSGLALRLPQSYKAIGGYHIQEKTKPLPKDLQKIMDEATHGVIYFSLGSMVKSTELPQKLKSDILGVLSSLKQTVIWKFEEELTNLPKNVHIVKWAPQPSILAHPNCIVFITHGGLLSTFEALHHGVPLIGIPIFADQFNNMNNAAEKGFGIRVDLTFDGMADELKAAIDEMLENPKYRNTMKDMSFAFRHRPVSPREEMLHWIDHVVQTRGAPHMRSPALYMPLYQKMYLDLAALIIVIVMATKYFFKFLFSSKKKVDLNKKRK